MSHASQPVKDHSEVEQLSRLLGQLAHEIKNPLSTVKVNLRLIDEDLGGQDTGSAANQRLTRCRRKLGVVQKEVERLENILDSFLRYADTAKPQFAEVDVNSLVGDMVDFYMPQAHSHNITLRSQCWPEPLLCAADGGMLKQAILNLFINATQATASGGELMIRVQKENGFAVIHISDTGTGIAQQELEHIFDAFYSSRPGGTGLGLPTTKKIVSIHGGSIDVSSEVGKGTLFVIRLPLKGKQATASQQS